MPTTRTLSEADSKALLAEVGVPILPERVVPDPEAAAEAAVGLGFPVVLKLCGDRIAHKTERGLVRLRLETPEAVRSAGADLLAAATADDGDVALLVAPMVSGNRELIAGLALDPQFGPTVMLGIGGILAEAVADVSFRLAPIKPLDADEMIEDLSAQVLLGAFRGEPPVDRGSVRDLLVALSSLPSRRPEVVSVDLNPLIVVDGKPVAVDALVEVTV